MKDSMKIVAGVGLFLVLMFGLSYYYLSLNRFFAPKQEELRRQVFEQSNSYNAGMLRDLENIEMQYNAASPEAKAGLKAIAIHRFSVYPAESLTPHLASFYNQLKAAQ